MWEEVDGNTSLAARSRLYMFPRFIWAGPRISGRSQLLFELHAVVLEIDTTEMVFGLEIIFVLRRSTSSFGSELHVAAGPNQLELVLSGKTSFRMLHCLCTMLTHLSSMWHPPQEFLSSFKHSRDLHNGHLAPCQFLSTVVLAIFKVRTMYLLTC